MEVEQIILTHESVIAQFAFQYAVRLTCNAPYAKAPAQRRKYEEEAFAKIIMYFCAPNSVEWAINYIHTLYMSHLATFADKIITSPKEQMRRDAYTAVYNLFCGIYPRREGVR